MSKYIFISGGVISGIGKGITAASVGFLLKSYGLKVTMIKADPYLNVDAGTMNPLEHGETFVLEDGFETDMDMGSYERFTGEMFRRANSMTSGAVFDTVIRKERELGYQGKWVSIDYHVPREIIHWITSVAEEDEADVTIIEIGGTVGEFGNMLFLEANRVMKVKYPNDVLHLHVSYLPLPPMLGEMKSKPVQMSVHLLNTSGINPDFIIARSERGIDEVRKEKLSHYCVVPADQVISAPDIKSIYEVPINFEKDELGKKIVSRLGLKVRRKKLYDRWYERFQNSQNSKKEIKIGIVGKYFKSGNFDLKDSYVSVEEAIKHASWAQQVSTKIEWFISDGLEDNESEQKRLLEMDGIIIPQGWGSRGVEGKIKAIQIARENKIPFLGLCFGMQMAAIEYARNVLKIEDATSEEVNENGKNLVIHLMDYQKEILKNKKFGGTIRLGAWPCELQPRTLLKEMYSRYKNDLFKKGKIMQERHRHRYEFNNEYREQFINSGFILCGLSPDKSLVEAIELPRDIHPFFVGTQYHPELKSQFLNPHPLFMGFIKNAIIRHA